MRRTDHSPSTRHRVTIPESLDLETDEQIDAWAHRQVAAVDDRSEWQRWWAPRERTLISVLENPKRLDRAFELLSRLTDALEQIDIPSALEREPVALQLAQLARDFRERLGHAEMLRNRGRQPATNYPLAVLVFNVLTVSKLKPATASRYVARRVGRIWSEAEARLTETQIRKLWGDWWWATDPKVRGQRFSRHWVTSCPFCFITATAHHRRAF